MHVTRALGRDRAVPHPRCRRDGRGRSRRRPVPRRPARAAAPHDRRAPSGPRVHRAAAPGRAHRLPGVRGPGGRADRQRARRSGPTTSSSPRSGSSPPPWCAASTPCSTSQYHRGTWHGGPYDPRATRFGPICIPIATQIAARGRLRAGPAARRRPRAITLGLLRRRQHQRGRLRRGGEPRRRVGGPRSSCSARTTDGRSACPPRSRPPARSGGAPTGYGIPGRARGRQRRAGRVRGDARRGRTGPRRRRPHPDRGPHVPDRRALHRRRRPAYRDEDEVEAARAVDPIARYRDVAADARVTPTTPSSLRARRRPRRSRCRCAPASSPPSPRRREWMFDWTYAEPPGGGWARQRAEALGARTAVPPW